MRKPTSFHGHSPLRMAQQLIVASSVFFLIYFVRKYLSRDSLCPCDDLDQSAGNFQRLEIGSIDEAPCHQQDAVAVTDRPELQHVPWSSNLSHRDVAYWIRRCQLMMSWRVSNNSNPGLPTFQRLAKVRSFVKSSASTKSTHSRLSSAVQQWSLYPRASACGKVNKWIVVDVPREQYRRQMISNGLRKIGRRIRAIMHDWCCVIVETASHALTSVRPLHISHPRVVLLTASQLQTLPIGIYQLLSTTHDQLAPKNIGYLYAMSQGAEVILDMDWNTFLLPLVGNNGTFPIVERSHGVFRRPLLYKEEELTTPAELPVWNPYPYFNLNSAWPRGYPWEYLSATEFKQSHGATESQSCLPAIQHFIIANKPDVDAVFKYRSTAKFANCEPRQTKLIAPRNVFAPYNTQATVHLRVAFWSLLLPTTVAKRVSDIWRSYIAQALLYLQPDVCVMFSSICAAMKPDFEGESQTIIDLAEELPLYTQAAPVIQLIRNLPLRAGSFDSAFTSVYQTLYEAGVLGAQDVTNAQAWMAYLRYLNIPMPTLPVKDDTWMKKTHLCIMYNDAAFASNTSKELAARYSAMFHDVTFYLDYSTFPHKQLVKSIHGPLDASAKLDLGISWPHDLNTYFCNSSKGFWQNRCLYKCLKKASEDGTRRNVFYMADDDYFNFTHAELALSKHKIWFGEIAYLNGHPLDLVTYTNYSKWLYKQDLLRIHRVLHKLPRRLTDRYLTYALESGKTTGNGLADSVYVPCKYHSLLMEVLEQMEKLEPEMFSEAGMPLAIRLVAPDQVHTYDPNFEVWRDWRYNKSMLRHWMKHGMHVHAVKLSVPGPRSIWRDLMAEQLTVLNKKTPV